jgi:hypothetical protein
MPSDPVSTTNPGASRANFTYSIIPTALIIQDTGKGEKTVLEDLPAVLAREQKLSRSCGESSTLVSVVRKILVLEGEAYGQAAPDGGPLRARRLEKFGRLELLQILNDQPPYWFVMIRNFDPKRDLAPGMKGAPSGPRRQERHCWSFAHYWLDCS